MACQRKENCPKRYMNFRRIEHRVLKLVEAKSLRFRLWSNEWGVVTIASLIFVLASSFSFGVAFVLVIGTVFIAVTVAVGISNGVIMVSAAPVRAFVI